MYKLITESNTIPDNFTGNVLVDLERITGYSLVETTSGYRTSVLLSGDDAVDDLALLDMNKVLIPLGWRVEWTGDSNTDTYGDTYADVDIIYNDESEAKNTF